MSEISVFASLWFRASIEGILICPRKVRLKGSNEWGDVNLADVYTIRDGKAIQMRAFADRQEALRLGWNRRPRKVGPVET